MTDNAIQVMPVVTEMTLTFSYARRSRQNVADYEHEDATAWVQARVPADAGDADVKTALGRAASVAKLQVAEELGLPYEVDAETGIVVIQKAFPGSTVVDQPVPAGRSFPPGTEPVPAQSQPHPASGEPSCPVCGGKMWDKRFHSEGGRGQYPKTNPKAPDWTCKDKQCDGKVWPPK